MTTTGKRSVADAELERLAREALRAHPRDFAAGVRVFQEAVEADAKLLIALVTRAELSRIEAAFVQKVQKHDIGLGLGQARGRVPPSHDEQRLRDRWRTVREEARSVLWTMMVAGKELATCTRGEVEKEARVCGRRAEFLRAVLALMPDDPGVAVKDAITPAKADELWGGLKEAA